jgi:predicted NBD/HSP70 family sugar kinase
MSGLKKSLAMGTSSRLNLIARCVTWRVRIGIDLGGTKIEGIALADDGRDIARRRVATPRDDYDATLRAVAEPVAKLERDAERPTVGIGTPRRLRARRA